MIFADKKGVSQKINILICCFYAFFVQSSYFSAKRFSSYNIDTLQLLHKGYRVSTKIASFGRQKSLMCLRIRKKPLWLRMIFPLLNKICGKLNPFTYIDNKGNGQIQHRFQDG